MPSRLLAVSGSPAFSSTQHPIPATAVPSRSSTSNKQYIRAGSAKSFGRSAEPQPHSTRSWTSRGRSLSQASR